MSNFQDSVLLIETTDAGKQDFGTGFVVHRDERGTYLLTCAHVITKKVPSSGEFQVLEKVEVRADSLILAEVEAWDRDFDLAVLRVQGLYNLPTLSLCSAGQPEMSFVTAGYYEFDKRSKQRQINQIQGKLLKSEERIRAKGDRSRVWKVEIAGGELLKPGYSGSPVLDETASHVFGVVSNLEGEAERERGSNIGWMVSIEALGKVWEQMPSNLIDLSQSAAISKGFPGFTQPSVPTGSTLPSPVVPKESMGLTRTQRRRLEEKLKELQQQDDFLSEKIQHLRKSKNISDLSPEQSFRLEKQIEDAEAERDKLSQQIEELENRIEQG